MNQEDTTIVWRRLAIATYIAAAGIGVGAGCLGLAALAKVLMS
ncbi:hypothetical protein [Massilia sp. X63]